MNQPELPAVIPSVFTIPLRRFIRSVLFIAGSVPFLIGRPSAAGSSTAQLQTVLCGGFQSENRDGNDPSPPFHNEMLSLCIHTSAYRIRCRQRRCHSSP